MPFRRPLPHVEPAPPRDVHSLLLRAMGGRAFIVVERSLPFRLIVWPLAPRLIRLTGGRLAALLPFPAEVIETRDPRNGRPHRRVVVYFHDGDRVTVAASKGGMADDPHWYRNAVADPEVRFAGCAYCAQTVTDDGELARLWTLADCVYPPHSASRAQAARSGRTIPLVQLTPIGSRG
ncbi:MAG TPA: nitroreductase/quinone reductase family protein [Solirubrobacteraceae bacterium]|jgi:deazaflavin-dependent oxidoreductase (nitroreductase family)